MKHFYLRDENKFPLACVVSEIKNGVVQFAVATHNPIERYNREQAISIATGRLNEGSIVGSLPVDTKHIKYRVVGMIASDPSISSRTRKAALHWMLRNLRPAPKGKH